AANARHARTLAEPSGALPAQEAGADPDARGLRSPGRQPAGAGRHPGDPARPAAHSGWFGPARAGPGPDPGAPARTARHRPELPALALAQGQRRPVARRPPGPLPPGRPGERDPAPAGAAAHPARGQGRGAGRRPVGRGPGHTAAPLEVPVVIGPGGSGGSAPRGGPAEHGPWFTSLPPCETLVPCGRGRHSVRWEAGELRLPSHADPEAELVLAALGGDKARCVEIFEAWQRHTADLTVLGIGPRGPADEIAVTWDDVDAAEQAARSGTGGPGRWGWRLASPPRAAMARAAVRHQQYQEEAGEASQ